MALAAFPVQAAWRHVTAREGFEVAFFERVGDRMCVHGSTSAVEDGEAWWVQYAFELDAAWHTRRAHVVGRSARGRHERTITSDGDGRWQVDGAARADLDGIFDVDLESSALTNAFPLRRLALAVGDRAPAPAVYVRALGLDVERLEQSYVRLPDDDDRLRFDYTAPAFATRCVIVYDAAMLALDYPGIAVRVAASTRA